jgi:AcrR family transcriptional regulator
MKTAARTKPASREGRIRQRNRLRILEAAITIFTQKGYDGTTIAEIAAAAGLPKANVYYYFRTKKAIYTTIVGDLIEEWDAALGHLRADRDPAEAIAAYVLAKLEFSRRHAAQSKMFASEVVHGGRFLSRANLRHMHAITADKVKVFHAWARGGRMDPVDPIHLFILLWGATQYYADFDVMALNELGVRRMRAEDFDKAAETITHIVLKGCGITTKPVRPRKRSITADSPGSSPAPRRADRPPRRWS